MRICVPLLPIPPVFNGAVMKRHQQIGLSLVELMIAMALGLVLTFVIMDTSLIRVAPNTQTAIRATNKAIVIAFIIQT